MRSESLDLTGKVALITGGGGGIGRATSLAFARAGARVAVCDLAGAAGVETAERVRASGGAASFFPSDVGDFDQMAACVAAVVAAFGRIDVLFNNAGIEGGLAPIAEMSERNWDRVISVNLKGVFNGLRHALPVMLAQRSGSIINTASVAGTRGSPGMAAYSTSKHAVIGLTRSAAGEVGPLGIRVNAICPGPVDTRMIHAIESMVRPDDPEALAAEKRQRNPMGRYGAPEEIARLALFLASDLASYVNGACYVIDGGLSAV